MLETEKNFQGGGGGGGQAPLLNPDESTTTHTMYGSLERQVLH